MTRFLATLALMMSLSGCATTQCDAIDTAALMDIKIGDSAWDLLKAGDATRMVPYGESTIHEYDIAGTRYWFQEFSGVIVNNGRDAISETNESARDWSTILAPIAEGLAAALEAQTAKVNDPPAYITGDSSGTLRTTLAVKLGLYRLRSVKRIGQDAYTFAGSQKFTTQYCYHDAYGSEGATYDTESRKVTWSDDSSCRIVSIFSN